MLERSLSTDPFSREGAELLIECTLHETLLRIRDVKQLRDEPLQVRFLSEDDRRTECFERYVRQSIDNFNTYKQYGK